MARNAASMARVICFRCRESDCACVAAHNATPVPALGGLWQLGRALAWLGGACAAGTALGAALGLLLSG